VNIVVEEELRLMGILFVLLQQKKQALAVL